MRNFGSQCATDYFIIAVYLFYVKRFYPDFSKKLAIANSY